MKGKSTLNDYPTGKLDTPLGTVNFAFTQADHVYLHNNTYGDNIVIRQIPYSVRFHCHLIDGVWKNADWHEPHLSRKDCINKETSQPARKTALEALSKAWTEYLAAHPELTREAALSNAQDTVDRIKADIKELQDQISTKEDELRTAEKSLKSI
jgi:hypothetical protein